MAAAGMTGTLSKDPVSGFDVTINKAVKAGRKLSYKGKTYYFASEETKTQFEKNPAQFVKE
jgi:YHS domain-containing protein